MKKNLKGWAFITPALILFLSFTIIPIIFGLLLGFYKTEFTSRTFIGFDNYRAILSNKIFIKALKNTFLYVIVCLPPLIILPLLLSVGAARLNQKTQAFLRFAYYLPYLASGIIISMVWKWLFHPDGGLFNYLLILSGAKAVVWLGSVPESFYAVCIVIITGGIGYPFLIYMATLTTVPQELYDMAKVDGCGKWQETLHVTLPALSPIIGFLVIIQTIGLFQIWQTIYVLTYGGPAHATTSIIFQVYLDAFLCSKYGYASAESVILLFLILAFSIIQAKYLLKKQ